MILGENQGELLYSLVNVLPWIYKTIYTIHLRLLDTMTACNVLNVYYAEYATTILLLVLVEVNTTVVFELELGGDMARNS